MELMKKLLYESTTVFFVSDSHFLYLCIRFSEYSGVTIHFFRIWAVS